jgi:hypothetical protein
MINMRYKEFTLLDCCVEREGDYQGTKYMEVEVKLDFYTDEIIEITLHQDKNKEWYVHMMGIKIEISEDEEIYADRIWNFYEKIYDQINKQELVRKIMEHPKARLLFLFI